MLTKKDFTQVANSIIKNCKGKKHHPKSIAFTINFFIDTFTKSNPRFDAIRFRDYIEKGIYE
tara:strand:+ start:463 stop:648 length:186 start_codon:yes stop_codon:yes gene_type:complete